VLGNETSLPVTVDELLPLTRAVSPTAKRALVVGDLPFGSYQASPEQAYLTAVRFMKEGGAHCVKLEGGAEMAPQITKLVQGGIPVMAHIGFTPQSEHTSAATASRAAAPEPRRSSPTRVRSRRPARSRSSWRWSRPTSPSRSPRSSTSRPSASAPAPSCDGQVLVWQDAFGIRTGRMPKFVKQYADLKGGTFPDEGHS
jgi:3-methyl-2-oxobutanoate hydroxymethyltransferase